MRFAFSSGNFGGFFHGPDFGGKFGGEAVEKIGGGLGGGEHRVVEAVAENEVGDHRRDSDDESGGGGDERFADVSGQQFGTAHAAAGDRLEGTDHAADGSE